MINILSYVGMSLQSEVCLWALLGVLRTIFDATLFKVNANLKQVWQMTMPAELSMSVQRLLRTMISGVMLVQCFTVYLYLATYIVLLYPVFLEERPILVLPWLLIAAIRKLLCELTSLALGLGTCLLLGPARPPCIKFLIMKISSITPAFYMWMLILSYYQNLKLAESFKRFPCLSQSADHDYGLELAVRRRRTKSLLGEEQLRNKLRASWYRDRTTTFSLTRPYQKPDQTITADNKNRANSDDTHMISMSALHSMPSISNKCSESGSNEYWLGNEIVIPRDTDRIMEQFVLMLIRVSIYLKTGGTGTQRLFSETQIPIRSMVVPALPDATDTPPLVGSTKERTAPYLRDYPLIFNKRTTEIPTMQSTPEVSTDTTKKITKHGSDNTIGPGRRNKSSRMQLSVSQGIEGDKHRNISLSLDRKLESKSHKINIMEPRDKYKRNTYTDDYASSDESLNKVIERMKKRVSANKTNSKLKVNTNDNNVTNTPKEQTNKEATEGRNSNVSKTTRRSATGKTNKSGESTSRRQSKKDR